MRTILVALRSACLSSLLLASLTALAQIPGEVEALDWCPGDKGCLSWTAAPSATAYNLYRGQANDLPALLDGTADSCLVGMFPGTTTGTMLDDPLPGSLYWYLVTAWNAEGEGGAGQATTGPRVVNGAGTCGAPVGPVLNEIDYDQPGTDFGEFVEIYNGTASDLDLTDVVLIFVNGLSSLEYARVELSDAGPTLPAGDYLVVGTADVIAALPPGTLSVTLPSSSNNIQNGAPDGVALFDTGTLTLLDALSYEGSITDAQFDGIAGTYDLVEGTAATAQDSNATAGSLSRLPDGTDTDDADSDWGFAEMPTPGGPN